MNGTISVFDQIKNKDLFKIYLEDVSNSDTYTLGSPNEIEAKVKLAKNVATIMGELSKTEYNQEQIVQEQIVQEQINKVATGIMNNTQFLSKVKGMTPENIEKLIDNFAFVQEFTKELHKDDKEKLKEEEPKAIAAQKENDEPDKNSKKDKGGIQV